MNQAVIRYISPSSPIIKYFVKGFELDRSVYMPFVLVDRLVYMSLILVGRFVHHLI